MGINQVYLITKTMDAFTFDQSINNRFSYLLEQYALLDNITSSVANINYTILFILAISSLNVYGIIVAG